MPSLKLPSLLEKSQPQQSTNNQKKKKEEIEMVYWAERKMRKIYSSKSLHAQSVLLILSLLLYQGQLDPLYCDQMPVISGKLNVLYILHHHLNHPFNSAILPVLLQQVALIRPYLSGHRLLKLLVTGLTDLSLLGNGSEWSKISAGAFGVVMAAGVPAMGSEVAVKQMNFPKSIYERCVLHDIFTEITCLEKFRLEGRVTRIYNFGIVDNTYVIIMRRYRCSLKDWRNHPIYADHLQMGKGGDHLQMGKGNH